jgi:hypothetical protein
VVYLNHPVIACWVGGRRSAVRLLKDDDDGDDDSAPTSMMELISGQGSKGKYGRRARLSVAVGWAIRLSSSRHAPSRRSRS